MFVVYNNRTQLLAVSFGEGENTFDFVGRTRLPAELKTNLEIVAYMLEVNWFGLVGEGVDWSLTLLLYDLFPELSESCHWVILVQIISQGFWPVLTVLHNSFDIFDDESFHVSTTKHEILVAYTCSDLIDDSSAFLLISTENVFNNSIGNSIEDFASFENNTLIMIFYDILR